MTVAIARHNNPDALLVLCAVAALWSLVRALENGRTRCLVLAGMAVGLGFEAKMAAALLVLWVAPRGRGKAVAQLLAGGAALVAVAGAWPALIALTPADSRPWVSGTSDNSVLSLILGYNGLGRLAGQAGGPQGMGGPGGGGVFGGDPGVLRLLDSSLGGQAGWLLGFAVVALVGIVIASRLRRTDARTGWLIAVGGSFATIAVAFSAAKGIFHPYYVSLLAPFTAALVGAGAAQLGSRRGLLAAAAVVAGMATELAVLNQLPGELDKVAPVMVAVAVLAAGILAVADTAAVRSAALGVALAALLIAPATWSLQTLGHATNGTFPAGGPATTGFAGGAMFGGDASLTEAAAYAEQHGGGAIAVSSQSSAAGAILSTGADVVGLGGFSGRESEVRVAWLAERVEQGTIR
jgi:4-amino-4-deoxy-L-arabinose transferase-like glycosyltransferase